METIIHIASPAFFKYSIKNNVLDGEIWSLATRLTSKGYKNIRIYDGYSTKIDPAPKIAKELLQPGNHIVLIHLWKVEVYGSELKDTLSSFSKLTQSTTQPIICAFGYLAASVQEFINVNQIVIDSVIRADKILALTNSGKEFLQTKLADELIDYFKEKNNNALALDLIKISEQKIQSKSVISLYASSGCRAKCKFCAYNADLSRGWQPRNIDHVVQEIESIVTQTPTRRIAFYDNDFGGSQQELYLRAKELHSKLDHKGLLGKTAISLNVRSECLSTEILQIFAEIGVKTILIGLESFNEHTRVRLFGKKVDIKHLSIIVNTCDRIGIEVLLSYIMWHPWQTLEGLHNETIEIIAWGRHRIPQLLTKSVLSVIPGTLIENTLKKEKLLLYPDPFSRKVIYKDKQTETLLASMQNWLDIQINNQNNTLSYSDDTFKKVAEIKLKELEFYLEALKIPIRIKSL